MDKKNTKSKLIDLLGITAYLLMAASCFLPFLNYTTLTSVETITYFQGNGKLIFGFSLLAVLFVILKFFKYTFMCLGLTIGVLIYDVTFGLLDVVRQKTTVYGLRYGFYLIVLGMVVNFIYIIIKMIFISKHYNKQYEADNDLKESVIYDNVNNDFLDNPQMQLLNGYTIDNEIEEDIDEEGIPSIDAEELLVLENEMKKEEITKPLSIFSDIPDIDLVNIDTDSNEIQSANKILSDSYEPKPLYKLCDNCGMQINYSDEVCPVCGKHF